MNEPFGKSVTSTSVLKGLNIKSIYNLLIYHLLFQKTKW